MQSKPVCFICALKQVMSTAERITSDPLLHKKVLNSAMAYLRETDLTRNPADLGSDMYHLACRELNQSDPFRPDMDYYNQKALSLYPKMLQIFDNCEDRLYQSILLAVVGNIIDLAIVSDFDLEKSIDAVLRTGLKVNDYPNLKEELAQAKNMLYIADNAGEIVFDRMLLQEIKNNYPLIDLTVAVKSAPAANDALREDALAAGIEQIANIIETGSDYLGIPKDKCKPEFWRSFDTADVIIAKGHANFETVVPNGRPIFVLLRAKCDVVAQELGVNVHDSVLKRL